MYYLVEDDSECENSRLDVTKVDDYEELEAKLTENDYDFTPGSILVDVKVGVTVEEALARPDNLILTSDSTKITYPETEFLIGWFCNSKAVIGTKDSKKYCKECFEKLNDQIPLSKIVGILKTKDEMYGLSTGQKIEYILVKNKGVKLSSSQIYDLGCPWDLKSFTPKNSVQARVSSLYRNGSIKRDGALYYS